MTYKIRHHGLIAIPNPGTLGIYWLRLYSSEKLGVAVVTEVPGNPGLVVTNAISEITSHLEHRFNIKCSQLQLFEVWPRGASVPPGINRVNTSDPPRWSAASRTEIESEIGQTLAPLPDHRELYEQVLALGGGVMEAERRPVFRALRVDQLSAPHNPFRCEHFDRFRSIANQIEVDSRAGRDTELEAGTKFLDTLTPADLRACSFHDGSWRAIADESVRIIETLGRRDVEDYVRTAGRSQLGESDRNWLMSLFHTPIWLGEGSFIDGQHRGCALRLSGADCVAVVTEEESIGDVHTDWRYQGEG